MKTKRQQWRLKNGLLYGGLGGAHGLDCVLTTADKAQVFDERDNAETKIKFWNIICGCKFEVEPCAS